MVDVEDFQEDEVSEDRSEGLVTGVADASMIQAVIEPERESSELT